MINDWHFEKQNGDTILILTKTHTQSFCERKIKGKIQFDYEKRGTVCEFLPITRLLYKLKCEVDVYSDIWSTISALNMKYAGTFVLRPD